MEAQRLTSSQRDVRVCVQTTVIDGTTLNKGDAAILLLVCFLSAHSLSGNNVDANDKPGQSWS